MSVSPPELGRPRVVAPPPVEIEPPSFLPLPSVRSEGGLRPSAASSDVFTGAARPDVVRTLPAPADSTPAALRALQQSSMADLGWESGRLGDRLEGLKRQTRHTPSVGLRQIAAPLLPMFQSALERTWPQGQRGGSLDVAGAAALAFERMEREHDFPLSSLRKMELLELATREGTFETALADPQKELLWSSARTISKEELLRASARPPTGVPPGLWSYATAFYENVQQASLPSEIAKSDPATGTDCEDGVWYVDHGPNHMRNVVEQVAPTLEATLKSGLISARDRPERVAFMESIGRMVAALHDMWMADCTAEGKREHAWRVGREAFSEDPLLTREVESLAQGDFGRSLAEVYGIPQKDLAQTVRELLSLGFAHSKSSVGLAPLESPVSFRALAQEMMLHEDPGGYGVRPETCISHYGSIEGLHQNSFRWLEENPELAADAIDVVRVIRTADGLRWRGIDYRGALGGQIALAAKGRRPQNLFRLTDPETGTTYVVRYADGPHMGETNTRLAELAHDGSFRMAIRTGGDGNSPGSAMLAERTADGFFAGIWREFAGSFADAVSRPIVIEAPPEPDGIAFAQQVVDAMMTCAERAVKEAEKKWEKASGSKKKMAAEKLEAAKVEREIMIGLRDRGLIRVEPSRPLAPGAIEARQMATQLETERFAAASEAVFSKEELSSLKALVDAGGVNTGPMDFDKAFEGAKRLQLLRGEVLMARGGSSDFVYIPLTSDALEMGLVRGYPALPVVRGVPVGELDVVAEQPREADWVAVQDTQVLALPAETYRREWAPHFYTRDIKDDDGNLRWPGNILRRLRRDYGLDQESSSAPTLVAKAA